MFYRNSRAENEKKTPKIFQKLFIEILVVSLCRVSQNFETVSESLELKYSLNILSRVTHDDSASIELALRTENEIEFESNLNVEPACRLLAFSFSQSRSLSFSLSLSVASFSLCASRRVAGAGSKNYNNAMLSARRLNAYWI